MSLRSVSRRILAGLAFVVALAKCTRSSDDAQSVQSDAGGKTSRLFTLLPSSATGVRFANKLTETPDFNVFTYRNFYNGGGVAIGDLTGDGLPEIVLTSNQSGPRLYLNLGAFHFRDITDKA